MIDLFIILLIGAIPLLIDVIIGSKYDKKYKKHKKEIDNVNQFLFRNT